MNNKKFDTEHFKFTLNDIKNTNIYSIQAKARITPKNKLEKGEVYSSKKLKQDIKNRVRDKLRELGVSKKYIFTPDLSDDSLNYNKSSYLKLTLFFTDDEKCTFFQELCEFFENCIDELLNKYDIKWVE